MPSGFGGYSSPFGGSLGSMAAQGWNTSGTGGGGGVMGYQSDEETEVKTTKTPELNVMEAKDMVNKILKTEIVPFLWGPPGVGKSTIVRDICKEHEWDLIDLRLSLLNPVDLRGLPVINQEDKIANWYPPSFLPKLTHPRAGILFLDEINLAPLSVQAAAYQLILDKRVGEYQFPQHWKIVAAGNRETDRANVYKISAPLANRFTHLTVTPNFKVWRDWAATRVRAEIIDFLTLRPTLLFQMPSDAQKAFPSPRTWEFASNLMSAFDYDEDKGADITLQQMVIGTIGEGTGKEFLKFLKDYKIKSISEQIKEFIATGKITMPKALSARYAIIRAICQAHLSKEVDKPTFDKFYKEKLSAEERETIKKFIEENSADLERKFGQISQVDHP